MRQDDINPRTGLVVALVSIFLVFGFMFTVSGMKGETLGDIPLLAIGPAICLPGVAAIVLAKKTDGCTKWPAKWPKHHCDCCKHPKDKEGVELLATPSEMESGKGSSNELDKKAGSKNKSIGKEDSSLSTITVPAESKSLLQKVDQGEALRYPEQCQPTNVPPGVSSISTYCVFITKRSPTDEVIHPAAEDKIVFAPSDTGAYSHRENSPYEIYHYHLNPRDANWEQETIV
uniref:Transmembrane protein 215 n=1 Tax=Geotrypetes seraphini TaxID=260995 RepID=A0A6P8P0U9_GEOSA|nr:transmembrane protein 215 [Geotrypetes seraphini]XP_033782492.1 transmembrane protein 215 [Geotrypetes seraphini]XP_033782499.1 transmembrane protein 215 [Geotrypetes seraphini]XP_033782507.1 transmembrane protein 215 [Geotrypetes seraphini]